MDYTCPACEDLCTQAECYRGHTEKTFSAPKPVTDTTLCVGSTPRPATGVVSNSMKCAMPLDISQNSAQLYSHPVLTDSKQCTDTAMNTYKHLGCPDSDKISVTSAAAPSNAIDDELKVTHVEMSSLDTQWQANELPQRVGSTPRPANGRAHSATLINPITGTDIAEVSGCITTNETMTPLTMDVSSVAHTPHVPITTNPLMPLGNNLPIMTASAMLPFTGLNQVIPMVKSKGSPISIHAAGSEPSRYPLLPQMTLPPPPPPPTWAA